MQKLGLKRYSAVSVLFDSFHSVRSSIHSVYFRFGASRFLVQPRTCKIDGIGLVLNAESAKIMAVVGDENNNVNFDFKIRSPPASLRSAVWQHFGFKVIVTDDKEVVEKEKTVCKNMQARRQLQSRQYEQYRHASKAKARDIVIDKHHFSDFTRRTQKAIKIPQVERISGRIRRVVTFFHKGTTASAILESKQLLLDLPKHKLIQDVATRWNSTCDMFTRYIEQQPAIFATLLSKDIKKNAKDIVTLSEDDLKAINDIVNVLKPMKNLTTLMCDSKHPMVSLIHPAKEMLLRQMAVRDDGSVMIKAVKHTIISDLEQRYHISYGITNIFMLHIFTLLCLA